MHIIFYYFSIYMICYIWYNKYYLWHIENINIIIAIKNNKSGRFVRLNVLFFVMSQCKKIWSWNNLSKFSFKHNIISYFLLILWWNVTWTCSWQLHVWMCLCVRKDSSDETCSSSPSSVNGTCLSSVPGCYLRLISPFSSQIWDAFENAELDYFCLMVNSWRLSWRVWQVHLGKWLCNCKLMFYFLKNKTKNSGSVPLRIGIWLD